MLGVLQIIYLVENYPLSTRSSHHYSNQDNDKNFPIAVKLFEFTIVCMDLLRKGKLYSWCNKKKNVWEVMNEAYIGMFFKFMIAYIEQSGDITTINEISDSVFNEARSTANFPQSIKQYSELDD